ncbi:UNVERIFIED_CONTAM: hypothetical protein PYX00_001409 [Menopon gallinae]|uniref:Phosphatidylinositol N-acetylglucosaminyltransferase subunit C n=1 Tax=Menopon gallinae TaxID=328185 RepID=A0AAW2IC77_9NEOP
MSEVSPKKVWKKNLYENSGFPDNYTDESFLQDLRKNIHKRDVTVLQAILTAGVVTEKICVVVVFSVIFVYLYNGWVEPETVFVHSNSTVCFLYLYYIKCHSLNPYRVTLARSMRMVVIFLVFCYILSPLLKTLTDTISTDTIYATASFMMFVHIIFCDYKCSTAVVSSSLSLNAAIFSAVCLASRLQTPFHAFVFLTLSAQFFVLYPYFSHAAMILLTYLLVCSVSMFMSFLYSMVVLFINLICPVLFTHWQIYKNNIYGPWDEAVIKNRGEYSES